MPSTPPFEVLLSLFNRAHALAIDLARHREGFTDPAELPHTLHALRHLLIDLGHRYASLQDCASTTFENNYAVFSTLTAVPSSVRAVCKHVRDYHAPSLLMHAAGVSDADRWIFCAVRVVLWATDEDTAVSDGCEVKRFDGEDKRHALGMAFAYLHEFVRLQLLDAPKLDLQFLPALPGGMC